MKLLAIDTATEACSAALSINGEIVELFQHAPREHTRLILSMIEQLVQQADISMSDLDALAFGRGPGSFTGVRIATGVVQGLAFALDKPVVPVSTLASMAQYAFEQEQKSHVLSAIDARMNGVYWACYSANEQGLMELQGEEQISPPEELYLDQQYSWCIAGSACEAYADVLSKSLEGNVELSLPDYLPHSSTIARLALDEFQQGKAVAAHEALPVYLRDDVAKKASEQVSKKK